MRSSTPTQWALYAWSLLVALSALHCARLDSPTELDSEYTLNNCEADADCSDGVCDPELRLCVVDQLPDDISSKNYFLSIIPPENSSLTPQVAEFSIRSADQSVVAYTLETPVASRIRTVRAVWTEAGLEIGEQLNSRVAFLPTGPGNPAIDRQAYVFQTDDDPTGTEISLAPGRYDLTVKNIEQQLADEYYPDLHLTNLRYTDEGVLLDENDLELNVIPVPRAPVVVRGVVRRGTLPENDLIVRALDPVEQRVVSTTDTTACTATGVNCGQFEIGLTADVDDFVLLISHKREPGYPTVRIAGLEVPSGQTEIDLSGDSRLSLPVLSAPLDCRARVLRLNPYTATDENPLSTQGATVIFRSAAVGGGEVFLTVTTNESGEVESSRGQPGVYLYPGTYEMAIYPPLVGVNPSADYGVYLAADPVVVASDQMGAAGYIQLPDTVLNQRARLLGTVRAGSLAVPETTIISTPVGQDALMRSSSALTGENGQFNLWYDPSDFGSYYLTIAPPADSGYPWLHWQLKDVSSENIDDLAVELPLPLQARIQLRAQGYTVEGTVVEFYEDIYLDEPAPLVGRGIADANGNVVALLPPKVSSN